MSFSRPLLIPAAFILLCVPIVAAAPLERRAVVFYTAEIHGVLEPCGCTSDPLGDFARMTSLVRGAGRRALMVDAGNLSFPAELSAKQAPAAKLRAGFLARELSQLPWGGAGLGESDLVLGPGEVTPQRLAVNLKGAAFVGPSRIVDVGGIKIGVLGIIEPEAARRHDLAATDPGAAAQAETVRLREKGAEVVILLAPVERPFARNLARKAGADIVVVGKHVGKGQRRAERVGDAFLVVAGQDLEYVGRLDIVLRGQAPRDASQPLVDAGGVVATQERLADLDRTLKRLSADIARWQQDKSSDPAFVAAKLRERDDLMAERKRLSERKWQPPAAGSYLTNALIPMRRSLPRDRALTASLRKLDRAIGAANLAQAEPPPPAEPGRAFYVGDKKCVACHKSADRAWRRSAHAHAWRTLVKVGKQAHDDCVVCHVTGFGEVGGSSLGHTAGLEDVQCEACHGPNSIHVEKRGKESPYAGTLRTPAAVCERCHNEAHSDTFQYEPYLRDALGPGHGEALLDQLGPGPTGRLLRRAAKAAARKH